MPRGSTGRGGRVAAGGNRIADPKLAKEALLEYLGSGLTVAEATLRAGRSETTYKQWRRDDPDFKARADTIIGRRSGKTSEASPDGGGAKTVPDFPDFCAEYLGQPLYRHQLQWFDIIEGRAPREIHPAMTYEPGSPQFVLVNTPPEHAKSTTLTMNYVTWRILRDPNIRVLIVSASEKMAKKFLNGIKQRLTGRRYRRLQEDFGPVGGFAQDASVWSATMIYVGGKDDGEKDPTVEALGMGGQIYGARADLIMVDDAVVKKNAHDYESQAEWLAQEVITRLDRRGHMMVIGTRVGIVDLYKYLRREYADAWTYFAQPAVLEMSGEPADWVTLWPATVDEDGEPEVKWDGPSLVQLRKRFMSPAQWARVFMQQDVAEDQIFPEVAVLASLNRQRIPGLLDPRNPGARPEGMEHLYVICSLDPALSGTTAAFVVALDTRTGKRWVLDAHNQAGMTPATIRQLMLAWTDKYRPREWRVEKNAMQGMLTQDEELRTALNSRGCRLIEHFTDGSKWDGDYGVAGMAPLFLANLDAMGQPTGKRPLIDLPYNKVTGGQATHAVDALVQQLITWEPHSPGAPRARPGTTDAVMALWFAEIRCRELMSGRDGAAGHMTNKYLSRAGQARRAVIDLDALALEQDLEARAA